MITERTCKALALLVGNVDCYTVAIWKRRVGLVNVAFSAVTSCSSLKQSHNYDKSCRAIALTMPRVKSHVPGAMHHWQLSVSGLSCWPGASGSWPTDMLFCCWLYACETCYDATCHTISISKHPVDNDVTQTKQGFFLDTPGSFASRL